MYEKLLLPAFMPLNVKQLCVLQVFFSCSLKSGGAVGFCIIAAYLTCGRRIPRG